MVAWENWMFKCMDLPWEIWTMILKHVRRLKFLHYQHLLEQSRPFRYGLIHRYLFSVEHHAYVYTIQPLSSKGVRKMILPNGDVIYKEIGV